MPFDPQTWAILAPIVLLASFVFQAAGFGAGLVAVPLATLFLDLHLVLPVLALLEFLNALRLVSVNRHLIAWREVWPLVGFSALGTLAGVSLLITLPIGWLMIGMAAFVAGFLVYQQRRPGPATDPVSRVWAVPAGMASGLGSAMFGMGGPPYLIYLHLRAMPFAIWRASFAVVGLFSLVWRISGFAAAGFYWPPAPLILAASLVPVALLAIWLAARAKPYLDERLLRRLVQILLGLAALTLMLRGIEDLRSPTMAESPAFPASAGLTADHFRILEVS
ncbi:MAG: sulfite exporter TauE/SafE family protein [Burkholderiaceae bacterium]